MLKQFKIAPIAAISAAIFSTSAFTAVYEITEIDTYEKALNAFSTGINSAGDVSVVVQTTYNPPIDLELIDFESDFFQDNLTDIDAAQNGNFNAEDYFIIAQFVRNQQGSTLAQQLASYQSYTYESGVLLAEPGFDELDPDFGGFSQSTETQVLGINDSGVTVGISEGKTYKLEYTNENGDELTYVIQDFGARGFVNVNGTTIGLESESMLAGGYTEAYDVNNGLLVAGAEISDPLESFETAVENCSDDEVRGDLPVEVCLQQRINSGPENNHQVRGVLWQLDQQGNVIEKTQLGLPITVAEDSTSQFISRALAVNESGVAVGTATNYLQENTSFPRLYPTLFSAGEVTTIVDVNEDGGGAAVDINNNGQVVGYSSISIDDRTRTKFFVYDINNESLTYPNDFFSGANTVSRAINDQGIVVGEGDVDTTSNTSARRKHGFIYDINEDLFQDLNDLVACNSPYTIVQANDINDSGQIAATAVVNKQVLDITGSPQLDDNGDPVFQDVVVSVLLDPIPAGSVDDCEVPPEEAQERKGGSMPVWLMFGLAGLAGLRRMRF
ncbi:MAG: DUF3466 family protein [Aestuariibacter sp.]